MHVQPVFLSEEAYLALDAEAPEGVKYEYDGQRAYNREGTTALAGADFRHNRIKDRVARYLNNQLEAHGCEAVTSDQRVQITQGDTHRYTYPDVVVVCGTPDLTTTKPNALRNPRLLVEVLSESTAAHDMDWKLEAYLMVDTLAEYWVFATAAPRVHRYYRTTTGWSLTILSGLDQVLTSEALPTSLPLADIYRSVFD